MNPVYIKYYSHEGCDCYKIDLPWTKYAKYTQVLCPVDHGYMTAERLATGVLLAHLKEVLEQDVQRK